MPEHQCHLAGLELRCQQRVRSHPRRVRELQCHRVEPVLPVLQGGPAFRCRKVGPAFRLQAAQCQEAQAHRCHQVVLLPVLDSALLVPEPFPEQALPVALKAKERRKVPSLSREPPSSLQNPS